MNEDVTASRTRISRRRALALGGSVGLGALIAACTSQSTPTQSTSAQATSAQTTTGTTSAGPPEATGSGPQIPTPTTAASGSVVSTTVAVSSLAGSASVQTSTVTSDAVLAMLDSSSTCTITPEATEGPYYIDLDAIRTDIREDRPGAELTLAVRVLDSSCAALPGAVVEIWHCDAGGVYSGFESASVGGGGQRGGQPGGGQRSGGSGGSASVTDDGTYLRGAQVTNDGGVAQFTTVYPGWYQGRTVHIHFKVHVDEQTVLTSQLFFDDAMSDALYAGTAPYNAHTGQRTTNAADNIFDSALVLTAQESGGTYTAVQNILVSA